MPRDIIIHSFHQSGWNERFFSGDSRPNFIKKTKNYSYSQQEIQKKCNKFKSLVLKR